MSDYYVSDKGSDSNPGTKAAPFKTAQKLVSIRAEEGGIKEEKQ